MYLDWSPDGMSVIAYPSEATGHPVLIDPVTGTWHIVPQLSSPIVPDQIWQRLATD